ncbi:MAG: chemotaxis protein CheW [Desulfuromonadaceae bacterium]
MSTMNNSSATNNDSRFLIFRLQGSLYALDLAQTAEVADLTQLWPIPLAPPCYSGAMSFHGDIVAVMNLTLFLGLSGDSKPEKIIILHQSIASLALLVDSVVRIVSADGATSTPTTDSKFSAATLTLPEGTALLLDLEVLIFEAERGMQKSQKK